MKGDYKEVGHVVAIFRHPVKAMQGERVASAHLGWHGIDGDRRYAFVRVHDKSGLPWVSGRETPAITAYRARFLEPDNVRRSGIVVRSPGGDEVALHDPELQESVRTLAGEDVRLMQLWSGTFDAMPVSLITEASIGQMEKALGHSLEVERFRPNIVVAASGERAFPEDKWVGQQLTFGDGGDPARIRGCRRDPRCSVVNLDPATGAPTREVHAAVVRTRKNQLGIYGSTERCGTISVGDIVRVRR